MKKVFRKFEVIKMLDLFQKDGFSNIGQVIEMLNNSIENDTDVIFTFDFGTKSDKLKEYKIKEKQQYRGEITYDEIKGCLNNQDLFDYGDN